MSVAHIPNPETTLERAGAGHFCSGDEVKETYSNRSPISFSEVRHNIVFQQKPASSVTVQGSLPILHHRLALTGTLIAPPGSAKDGRYVARYARCLTAVETSIQTSVFDAHSVLFRTGRPRYIGGNIIPQKDGEIRPGVEIYGEIELIERILSGAGHYSHCISIRNPHESQSPEISREFNHILELKFYDIEGDEFLPKRFRGRRKAELEDVRSVESFVRESMFDRDCTGYTVHCARGISRSTAIALGVLYLTHGGEDTAVRYLRRVRPAATPLPRILRLWDQLLGSRLEEAGEWIRYELYQEMRSDLSEISSNGSKSVSFADFRAMRKNLDQKELGFIEELDSDD